MASGKTQAQKKAQKKDQKKASPTKKKAPAKKKKVASKPLKSLKKAAVAKTQPKAKPSPKAEKLKGPAPTSAAKGKAEAAPKKLNLSVEEFLEFWKPKSESLSMGFHRFCEKSQIALKDRPAHQADFFGKVRQALRKESLSSELEEQLMERYPKDRVRRLASIFSMKPRTTIRLNVLKADLKGFQNSLAAKDLQIKPSTMAPWAFEIGKPEEAKNHIAYQRGLFDLQDEASQIVALLSNARPGQRILDMCAQGGEKSLMMALMMKNKGSLFVYDSDPAPLKEFRERANALDLKNFRVLGDTQIAEVRSLDAVVVEAPSSETGALGSHPENKLRFSKDDLPKLQKLQAALIREGARKLKLGGYLIYATRSLNRSENEGQIEHFLKTSHNSYRLVSVGSYLRDFILPYISNYYGFEWDPKVLTEMLEPDPFFLLPPDIHGGDGLFVAILQRTRIST